MTKNEIAEVLDQIATLLELKGENPFKVRAYSAGARALEAIEPEDLARLVERDELQTSLAPRHGDCRRGRAAEQARGALFG